MKQKISPLRLHKLLIPVYPKCDCDDSELYFSKTFFKVPGLCLGTTKLNSWWGGGGEGINNKCQLALLDAHAEAEAKGRTQGQLGRCRQSNLLRASAAEAAESDIWSGIICPPFRGFVRGKRHGSRRTRSTFSSVWDHNESGCSCSCCRPRRMEQPRVGAVTSPGQRVPRDRGTHRVPQVQPWMDAARKGIPDPRAEIPTS